MRFYYVYVLKYDGKKLYIGYTNNINQRYKQHCLAKRDCKLLYYEAYQYEAAARLREQRLKYYGSAWRALKQRVLA